MLDVSGSAAWSRTNEDTGTGETSELYSAGFDADGSWISSAASVARWRPPRPSSRRSGRGGPRYAVSLLAETALNYVEVRTLQAERTAVEANLATQNDTLRLVSWRQQAGLSDDLAVQQARYNLENTRSQIPSCAPRWKRP